MSKTQIQMAMDAFDFESFVEALGKIQTFKLPQPWPILKPWTKFDKIKLVPGITRSLSHPLGFWK